ncbi:MAG TPA: YicC/YloC family endoribonuclease [Bacteroidales bacterium]|nr:YicC/YloC family endoribonuclease [Bacteroidales bacterium]
MTGFGKTTCQLRDKSLSIEVRSLNSKSLDVSLKMANISREKEHVVRNHVGQILNRGKIDVAFVVETSGGAPSVSINKNLFGKFLLEFEQLTKEYHIKMPDDILQVVIRLPEVITYETIGDDPGDWAMIEESLLRALSHVDQFRISEGQHLAADIIARINSINELAGQIAPFEAGREQTVRTRLTKGLKEINENLNADPNRFEQELIFYLERLDITEEKIRLAKHLDYFVETLEMEKTQGRKLGFIAQEIGREINTIGSKANEANIQKIVVQMKDELEKIKEQLLNIL